MVHINTRIMEELKTSKSFAPNNLLPRDKRVGRSNQGNKNNNEEGEQPSSCFERHKLKVKALMKSDISIEDRMWASRLADSFDTTVEQKRLILKQFIEAIKWGQ